MTIAFSCPQCNKEYKVDDDRAGKRTTCPNCKTALTVPAASSVTPPTPLTIEPAQQEPVNPFTVPMPVQQEPDNPFTAPMPVPPFSVLIEPAQPQPADEATNDSNGDGVLGGVLGGGAGLVIGTMIARKIVLENPNLTTHEITNTTSFSGLFEILSHSTMWGVLPTTEGFAVFFVIILLFTVFGAFIGAKIGKK